LISVYVQSFFYQLKLGHIERHIFSCNQGMNIRRFSPLLVDATKLFL